MSDVREIDLAAVHTRAPDAPQRFFSDAVQSRGPWLLGPGSAQQRCTLQRVRDTDPNHVSPPDHLLALQLPPFLV